MTERPTQAAQRKFAVPRKVLPYLMLAPALIIIFVFKIYPIVSVMITSFIRDGQFTFRTYEILLGDRTFWMSLWTTIKMNLVMIPLQIVLSLALALLVNSTVKGIGIFRSIYYLPVTMAISVAAITWELMANYNNGVFNSLFTALGIGRQGLFTDANQALWCIVVMATWKGCGMWMMYILAGLKGVDTSIYESARLDGAGYFPMQLITEGGPQNSTNVLMYEVYKSAFQNGNASRAGALTTILLIIVLTVVIIQFRMLNEKEE